MLRGKKTSVESGVRRVSSFPPQSQSSSDFTALSRNGVTFTTGTVRGGGGG